MPAISSNTAFANFTFASGVVLPIGDAEHRSRVSNMAKGPQAFVGETVVIALFFVFRQPDSS